MGYAGQMLGAFPVTVTVDADLLAAAIGAVGGCARACGWGWPLSAGVDDRGGTREAWGDGCVVRE